MNNNNKQKIPRFLTFICTKSETIEDDLQEIMDIASEILAERYCPCQCGRFLPGSSNSPACFGCSVGKNEISYVLESLEAGRKPQEIIMDLNSPITINIYADYTDPYLAKIWKMVKKAANKLRQNRVVLRTPGLTREARRALKLVECARLDGKYSIIQEALINHTGPWDWDTLVQLAAQNGQPKEQTGASVHLIDIEAQIAKDQQHARESGIGMFPAITINHEIIQNTEQAILRKIKEILREESI